MKRFWGGTHVGVEGFRMGVGETGRLRGSAGIGDGEMKK